MGVFTSKHPSGGGNSPSTQPFTIQATKHLSVSAMSLSFSTVKLQTSSTLEVELTSDGNSSVNLSGFGISGVNSADYATVAPAAGTSPACAPTSLLAPGQQCRIGVRFEPSADGLRVATLNVTSNANTVAVGLSGTGAQPTLSFSPPSTLDLGNVKVGDTSSGTTQLTLTNSSPVPLTLTSIALDGPNGGEFSIVSNNCGSSLGAGSMCTLGFALHPTTAGSKTANVNVISDAASLPASPVLSGKGTQGIVSVASSLDLGSVATGTVKQGVPLTVANIGDAPLAISGLAIGGVNPSDFQATGCTAPVNPSGQCSVNVVFSPLKSGARSGTLDITSDGTTPRVSVALTGSGLPGTISLSSASLTLDGRQVGTGPSNMSVALTNSSASSVAVTMLTVTGTNSGDFAATTDCPAEVVAGGACHLNVGFTPEAAGPRTATLIVQNDGSTGPLQVTLLGTGTDFKWDGPATASGTAGASTTFNLTLEALSGLTGTASVSCDGAPGGTLCVASPATAVLSDTGTVVSFTLQASTQARRPVPGLLLTLALVMCVGLAKSKRRTGALLALAAMFVVSCGKSVGQPAAGTYSLTAHATLNGVSRSWPVTVNVN